ncbi:MAG: gliding motility-associated C-terminal domain-containing protein, partial [Saprospiraceae bacterium]
TASVTASLSDLGGPNVQASVLKQPDCGQNNGEIQINASAGQPPYAYSIDGTNYQTQPVIGNLGPGDYIIWVRDALGCVGNFGIKLNDPLVTLPPAAISVNQSVGCSNSTFVLTGNLPAGLTGVWSSDEIMLVAPEQAVLQLANLAPGDYVLNWTLSSTGCPAYSVASATITVQPPPTANNDGTFQTDPGFSTMSQPLLNDVYSSPVSVRILKTPQKGSAFFDQQQRLIYQPNPNAAGIDSLSYEICLLQCQSVCDTAWVLFNNGIPDDPCFLPGDTSNILTNGLTPNGDGINDNLVFRVVSIEECQINHAKGEIIIYNRWGDIVYEASPYNNDWSGTNRKGEALPPGVYYFILRITLDKVYTQFGSVILIR